jgi:glycosyltransferase involved in cell wall biosynthesis
MHPTQPPISLVLADCAESPSVERAIWELAVRLPRARYQVRVWLSADPAKDPLAAALASRQVAVDRMPPAGSSWGWRGLFDAWMRLRRARPSLVHIHQDWPGADGVPPALTDTAGVRLRVVSVHGPRAPESAGPPVRRGLDRASALTTTCQAHLERLVAEAGVPRERVRCVPCGTDPADDEAERGAALSFRERVGAGHRRPLWLCPGRLEAHRGPQVFLDALGLLREQGLPFVGVVLGDGPLRPELVERAAQLGLGSSLQFVDGVDDPGPALLAADGVVLPSLWDGSPGALYAAMMRSRPLIASGAGFAADAIENGVTGRLVPPGDARALADALATFHRRPDAAQRLGRAAGRHAEETYTWARVVEGYEAVYDEALGLATFTAERAAVARGRW